MRNFLAFLAALVVTVAAVGWYLGWYQVYQTPAHSGHQTIKIDVNTDKVSKDLKKGEDEVLQRSKALVEKDSQQGGDKVSERGAGKDHPLLPSLPEFPGQTEEESSPEIRLPLIHPHNER